MKLLIAFGVVLIFFIIVESSTIDNLTENDSKSDSSSQQSESNSGSNEIPILLARKCKNIGEHCKYQEDCCSKRCLTYHGKCVS